MLRTIVFSWEYPPRVVGQLSGYVKALTAKLAANKVNVNVVTYDDRLTGETCENSGVKTVRVTNPVKTHVGVLTWVLTLNQEIERAAANIYYSANKKLDLIDVFDWHFIPAAITLKNGLGIPFVYSVESLEDHRSPAGNSSYNMAIKSIEWLGFYEAKKVTAKSEWMKNELIRLYSVPEEKIAIIPSTSESWIQEVLKVYRTIMEDKKNER
ncbi:MAG: glycosyltransferase [Candidatus Bathyarchaeota archaeon]|nr:glycosyltransferase [Candidatus Bathyarchaeota archaeon]MDI9578171.1 glycosyltransferase [Thermoproteota archaeon]MDT8781897.1 glycosyltransferase [Candidatus Bathyarchaeota archaeon]NLD65912.1 glycosyltransferase family 4 protein [Thermoproteota archaeon]